jgi:thioredoxin-dependent peroxiredoxin
MTVGKILGTAWTDRNRHPVSAERELREMDLAVRRRDGRSLTPMKTGDTVADFELPDQTGTPRKLSALLSDGPVVLFFYPAAMTPGCTKEACHFRDLAAEFAAVGANRVGISTDPVQKQAKFADMQNFDYPLLSDTEGRVATQFGVKRGLIGKLIPVKRTTFVIDTDRTVLDVISSELSMDTHADKALETLRTRSSA